MTFKVANLSPRPTDRLFYDSSDAGTPECVCSRCGNNIETLEQLIRIAVGGIGEYRLCGNCCADANYLYRLRKTTNEGSIKTT